METLSTGALRPSPNNPRTHSAKQIKQIAASIRRFGFTNPVLITDANDIVAGHGRVHAAKLLGIDQVPVLRLSHLTPTEIRAYIIADNKLALNAGWDAEILAIELQALVDLDFDVELTGFSLAEIDLTLDAASDARPNPVGPEDEIPGPEATAVTQLGDVWQLGRHRLVCGDARSPEAYSALLGDERAGLIFTDPPYNVPIDGHVCGSGRVHHREFAMGVGEMTEDQFTEFLRACLQNMAAVSRNGAIAFVCMDWRHIGELLAAAKPAFSELKNICVWNKTNGGMGTFYRSKHEFVCAFKVGQAPHTNTFGLGDTGRYRTNVWDYPGVNSMGKDRAEALEMHPTVKPVALVADAIKDCTRRGDIVLDPFGGSGTSLIAAQKCGRIGRLIEFDPLYCDVIVRRYQRLTGKLAVHVNGSDFEAVEALRFGEGQ